MSYRTTAPRYPLPPQDGFLLKDLEGPVETLSPEAAVQSSGRVQLRNVKPLASYSWIEGRTPSIVVPGQLSWLRSLIGAGDLYRAYLGCPRIWQNTIVTTVPADTGVHYLDRNTSFMGHRPSLTPIFAAVDSLHDDFQYRDLDLVTDRNNLRKLLRCIDRQQDKTFRIDIDLLGKTCLFTRREETLVETIKEFRGYGHEYELAATKPRRGSEGEISHHRIVRYVSHCEHA